MTKKDYIRIAVIVNSYYVSYSDESETVENIALDLADMFEKENPRFDRDRFLIACGVPR